MTPHPSHRIHPGRLFMTEAIVSLVRSKLVDILTCLDRHATGDWGDISEARKELNETAIETGGLIVSRYQIQPALSVVILSHEERSLTKCMLLGEFLDDLHD